MSADNPTADALDEVEISPIAGRPVPDDFGPGDMPQNDIEAFADALFSRVLFEPLKR